MASRLFSPLSPGSERNLLDTLREERVGGALLLAGTVVALLWANIWPDAYETVSETVVGPAALHLDLSLATWATDGLLAIFFFVVGLELKREIVAGELRVLAPPWCRSSRPSGACRARRPLPAVNLTADGGVPTGWAIPMATDIAFAVSVLAIVGRSLPNALRAFLLTLAVVDDLLGDHRHRGRLHRDRAPRVARRRRGRRGALRARDPARVGQRLAADPARAGRWAAVHASGVHATIAGVALGLVVPGTTVATQRALRLPDEPSSRSRSGGSTRGVRCPRAWPCRCSRSSPRASRSAQASLTSAFADPVAQGVALGLVVGKPLGIFGGHVAGRHGSPTRPWHPVLRWGDVAAIGLAGRHRVHRLAARRRAGVRARQRAGRARRRLDHRRLSARRRARRARAHAAGPLPRA